MGKKDKSKKKKKSKKKTKSSSSESSSSGEEMWVEKTSETPISDSKQEKSQTETIDPFELMFSSSAKSRKELNEQKPKDEKEEGKRKSKLCDTELEETITSRELNPYWKNGGKGLPSAKNPDKDRNSSDKLHNERDELDDNERDDNDTRFSSVKSCPRELSKISRTEVAKPKSDLNKLSADLLKAELMGDSKKIEELKELIEDAKSDEASRNQVMLTKIGPSGAVFPVSSSSHSSGIEQKKRRGKIETHDSDGKRVRYGTDDDGQSINDMLVREKSQTAVNQNRALMKFMGGRGRGFETLDDKFESAKAMKKSGGVEDRAMEEDAKSEQRKALQTMDECYLCFNSAACKQRLVVRSNEYCYLSLPFDTPLVKNHCLICPVLHYNCSTLLDEEVFERIEAEKRFLVEKFAKLKKRVIFVECFRNSKKFFHMYIECIPVGRSSYSEAPMFFKKAIMESEEEWSMNKKLVDLKNNDVRRTIPKGLSYFTVQFGLDPGGFAHVIEDCSLFPRYFARQVVGGMSDLDDFVIHRPKALDKETQLKNVERFKKDVLS